VPVHFGSFDSTYDASRDGAAWDALFDGLLEELDAAIPTNVNLQAWDLSFSGIFEGQATLVLDYDSAQLPGDEGDLAILHYDQAAGTWTLVLDVTVDPDADTITFATTSFSPFILTVADRVTHTISVSAGPHGSVAPGGEVSGTVCRVEAAPSVTGRQYRVYSGSNLTSILGAVSAGRTADTNVVFSLTNAANRAFFRVGVELAP